LFTIAFSRLLGSRWGAVAAMPQGYAVLRTDRNGWIELSTDGEQMWVEVERR
jgi:hypothetical protein